MCVFRLRTVTPEDAKMLFAWTNDPVTRQNSFQSKPVLWEEHVAWLQRKLEDENCFFFILTDGKRDYGTIRVDCITVESNDADDLKADDGQTDGASILGEEKYGLISFSIAPEQRGKGLGRKMLLLLESTLKINRIEAGLAEDGLTEERQLETQQAESQEHKSLKLNLLRGEVKKSNIASRRCFEENGYDLEKEIAGELIFFKRI